MNLEAHRHQNWSWLENVHNPSSSMVWLRYWIGAFGLGFAFGGFASGSSALHLLNCLVHLQHITNESRSKSTSELILVGKCSQSCVYKSNCCLTLQKLRNLSILDVWNGSQNPKMNWFHNNSLSGNDTFYSSVENEFTMMPFAEGMHTFLILHCRLLLGDTKSFVFLTFDWQVVFPTKGFHGGMSESLHEMPNMNRTHGIYL